MKLMKQTYWAQERSEEDVLTAVKNSVSFGAFDEKDNLVGFARVVTDERFAKAHIHQHTMLIGDRLKILIVLIWKGDI